MKSKLSHILILGALALATTVACEKNEEVLKSALKAPSALTDSKSYNKLTFNWSKIDKAIQYGYVLTNPSGKVIDEGTTTGNTVSFSGLLPNTEYTLTVWAFPSLESDYTSSPSFTLSEKTDPLKKVDAPMPVAEQSTTKVVVSWEAVSVASTYTYTLSGPGIDKPKAVETEDTEVSFYGLASGTFEFSIFSNCSKGGYETTSPITTISFDYFPPQNWRAMGNVTNPYVNNEEPFPGILAYDEQSDSYTIEAWCGVIGYDFNFKMTADGMVVLGVEANGGYYPVPTGLENPSYLNVYTAGGYSTFEGDKNSGEIWIGHYDPSYTDWDYVGFYWDADSSHPTIDDICGSYQYWNDGYDWFSYSWNEFSYGPQSCTISKLDESTVWVSTLLLYPGFEGCGFYATYNEQTLTLNVPIQDFATYYRLGLDDDDYEHGNAPVEGIEAKFAGDGSISMFDWVVYYYYSEWWYKYIAYTKSYWYPASADDVIGEAEVAARVARLGQSMNR